MPLFQSIFEVIADDFSTYIRNSAASNIHANTWLTLKEKKKENRTLINVGQRVNKIIQYV